MKIAQFIKKFIVIIIAVIFIAFLFIYRQYNIKKNQELKDSFPNSSSSKQEIVCADEYKPVCGKDGHTYSNSCVATNINEIEISSVGECPEEVSTDDENLTGSGIGENNLGETPEGTGSIGEDIPEESTGSEDKEEEKMPEKIEIPEIKATPEYYKNLKSQCEDNACCIASVDTMENGNHKEAIDDKCREGYSRDMLKCMGSYKWCVAEKKPQISSGSTSDSNIPTTATGTVNGQKVLNYANQSLNYGFSLPSNSYFSGYGSQEGASHTVGISSGTGVSSLGESDVKVYFYKQKVLPELKGSADGKYEDPASGKIYLEVNGNTVVIEGAGGNNKIVDMITNTIYAK